MKRRNSQDEEIRRLEREAADGDIFAARRLRQIRRRLSARPSKFRKFATWDELGYAVWPKRDRYGRVGFQFAAMDDMPPGWIWDAAWEHAKEWIKAFEKKRGVELTDEQKSAAEAPWAWALERHYTAEALLKDRLNEIFGPINELAGRPLDEDLGEYWRPPKVGVAIDWGLASDPDEGDGIWFKVFRPILRVLQEERRDDTPLSRLDIEDLVSLSREIWSNRHGGGRREFMDLRPGYENWWDTPSDEEIEKEILGVGPLIPRTTEEEPEEDLS